MDIEIAIISNIEEAEVLEFYRANKWSTVANPNLIIPALKNSHTLVTARNSGQTAI